MSLFERQGLRTFWTYNGDIILPIDEKVVTPVIEKLGGRIDIKFPMGSNAFVCVLFCRRLEIVYDFQENDTPLEIAVYDQCPRYLLGTFTPEWDIEESRERFEQFLRAIV